MNSEKKKIINTGSNLIKTAKEKAVPFVKKTIDETKEFTTQKIIPEAKNFVDETKNTVSKASKKSRRKNTSEFNRTTNDGTSKYTLYQIN